MSLAQVKSVIENFIENDKNDLLTIKGNWGVGKTYFWQNTVVEVGKKGKIGKPNYSYVSLFGVNSIDNLKNSIMANQISSLAISKNSFTSGSVLVSELKKVATFIEKNPKVRAWTEGWANELSFQIVNDSLVCFDDLERKGDSLDIKDILGLASFLEEQRNCKVVFILNDGTLSEEDKKNFSRHNEKVVDIELNFSPLPEEVFDYIFTKDYPYYELVKHSCLTLKVKNIRILQRIKRFIDDLLGYLNEVEEIVAKQAVGSMILFVWSYYEKDSEIITLNFIENFNSFDLYFKKTYKNEELTKEEENIYELLSRYDYGHTDDLDKELINFVKNGHLSENFLTALTLKNDEAISQKEKDLYSDVWKLYRTSLNLDENEFIEKLIKSFRAQVKYLSYSDLYEVVITLRKYDRNDEANTLIDEFLLQMINYEKLTNLRRSPHFNEYEDSYFLERLKEIKKPNNIFVFSEIIDKLIKDKYLDEDELEFLKLVNTEQYYDYLKSDESGEFYFAAKALLSYGNNQSKSHRVILAKTKNALVKIAKENRINRNRICEWLKIEIED